MNEGEVSTWYIKVHPATPEKDKIRVAAELLRQGKLVAFPTETVYGLGANAFDPQAVSRIFLAKGRPADNPLIVHIAEVGDLSLLVSRVTDQARTLAAQFWPGPLTLVLPKSPAVIPEVTCGLDTVAVRMPSHPVALALIREAGVPVAAPSANRSGEPSPTTGIHVLRDLAGRVDVVLDAGTSRVGLESTVLDLSGPVPTVLRPGGVTVEELREVLGEVEVDPAVLGQLEDEGRGPRSPGMKYAHYAPQAQVHLVEGSPIKVRCKMEDLARQWLGEGKKVGILTTASAVPGFKELEPPPQLVLSLGQDKDLAGVAHELYSALRKCDQAGVDLVLAETFPLEGLGLAVMNRLRKAAGYRVIRA